MPHLAPLKPDWSNGLYPSFRKVRNYTSIGGVSIDAQIPLNPDDSKPEYDRGGESDSKPQYDRDMREAVSLLRHAECIVTEWDGVDEMVSTALDAELHPTERGYILEDLISAAHFSSLARAKADWWSDPEAKTLALKADRRCRIYTNAIKIIAVAT